MSAAAREADVAASVLARPVVIGASGQVGGAFHRALLGLGLKVRGTYHSRPSPGLERLDLADDTGAFLNGVRPSLVVLASALTHVDYCESHPEETHRRNVTELEPIVDWCAGHDTPLVFFSTDYVFDGEDGPYAEDAVPRPLNVYGRSKLEGERRVAALARHAILRITNVFDVGHDTKNFLHRCVEHLRDGRPLVVPSDQWATPTPARWLAARTLELIAAGKLCAGPGLLHVACDELVSRAEFATRVAALLGADPARIEARPTAALGQAARRPLRGGLQNGALKRLLGVAALPLDRALHELLPDMRRIHDAH